MFNAMYRACPSWLENTLTSLYFRGTPFSYYIFKETCRYLYFIIFILQILEFVRSLSIFLL